MTDLCHQTECGAASELRYEIIRSELDGNEVFGIRAKQLYDGRVEFAEEIDDIFCSLTEAEAFAVVLRDNFVEPCHLADVAEDWLCR